MNYSPDVLALAQSYQGKGGLETSEEVAKLALSIQDTIDGEIRYLLIVRKHAMQPTVEIYCPQCRGTEYVQQHVEPCFAYPEAWYCHCEDCNFSSVPE